jgi:nitroreductase
MFMSLIEKRRSIRRFTGQDVESEKIDILLEAALRSPSSRGFNLWCFVVVTNQSLLEKLSTAKHHGSSFLRNGPLGIVTRGFSMVWISCRLWFSALVYYLVLPIRPCTLRDVTLKFFLHIGPFSEQLSPVLLDSRNR